ncbi:polycystin-1-like protein 2 [Branchiostoma floridae x Branchiostoma japonicum]
MIVMKKNLFSWNASTFGENVTTPVTMFSWGSQRFDHNCSVQLNLSHPIAIENIEDPRRQKRDLQERGLVGAQFALGGIVVGQNSNATMVLYAFDVPAVTAVVVMQLSWWDHAAAFRVFFRYDTPPTEQLYDDKMIVEEEDAVRAWRRGTNSVRKFVPNVTKRRGRLYVGVQKAESDRLLQTALTPKDFVLQASAVSCLNWDHTFEKWQDVGCGVGVDPFDSTFRCNCDVPKPKAVIGGSLHALPNTIELDDIFKDPSILNDNNLVYYTVICEWTLYLVLMIILNVDFQRFREKTTDKSSTTGGKKQLPQLSVLPSDRMPAPHLYQITVTTGSMLGAGTSARIGLQVFGSKSKTAIKMINPDGESLPRGGTHDVIMPLKTSLGHLELLHIWHDNTGVDETSWFLRDIIVKDLQTKEVYQFICYDWLSEDRGDFQVQKVLHVATQEQLGCFSSQFRENADAMFYDQHLWTSPFVSPEGSSFTKSERLSCCCAVFNSIMLSNAMWYKSDDGFVTKNTVFDLGFVQITLQELYVSLMTVVMVLPVVLVPARLFRVEVPTSITAPGIRRTSKYGLLKGVLSRWSKYVAWFLVVMVSILSSFFVILYSLDWGREKSEAWLKAFFFSFGLSSIIAETAEILFLATLFALICNQRSSNKQKTYNIKEKDLHLHLYDHKAPVKVYPPGAVSAEKMKVKNQQRRKFFFVMREYVLLFLFVVVLFFISHHDKDPFAFNASQTLHDTVLEDHDSITTADEFWTWTEEILLPVLYPSFWYNGWKMKYLDRQFPLYTEAFRIGPPRLTQFRKAPDDMATDLPENGWMVETGDGKSACWKFNVTGVMSHNSGCSAEHSMDLPTLLGLATAIFSDLRDNQWIDKYTDYLVLDLSLYYPAQKLFSSLRLTVKQEDVGHLSTSASFATHRLFQYENDSDMVALFSYILFMLLFLVNIIKEATTMKKEGRKFFSSMWNIFAFASIIGSAAVIGIFGIRYHSASAALAKLVEATGELGIDHFVDLSSTFWWDEVFKTVLAIVLFITTLTLLRVFRFSKTIASFIALPGAMKNDLIGFSIISAIAFMAFSCSGMLVFGTHMKAYTNVLHTNFALFEMLLGRFFAEEILESNRYIGPIFFTFFMILIFILLVNFLVTIICDAIASGVYVADEHDQELADYIWRSFQGVLGIHVPPPKDVISDEMKETELNTTFEMIAESLNETLDVTSSLLEHNRIDEPSLTIHDNAIVQRQITKQSHEVKCEFDAMLPSTSSAIGQQVENLLKAHEEDTARYEEVQNKSRRRAEAMLKRKLAEKREKTQTMVHHAQEMMEQHAAYEERLVQQQRMNRRLFQSKLRQKMALRGFQKRDDQKQ